MVAQYYGHTHHDEFVVFYDSTSRRPTNIAFVTPSVATWTNFNPSYRIFTIDGGYDGASYVINYLSKSSQVDNSWPTCNSRG